MASSPLRAPAGAGQPQSRLMDMQKKFQQRHMATLAAVKGVVGSTTSSTSSSPTSTGVAPVPPTRRFGVSPQQQQPRKLGGGAGPEVDGADSLVQVDVKGKVRQLFAERNQLSQSQGTGYQHHQQLRRQRRRSLTGRDRSRPLRPLSDPEDDPLSKTVCFTGPSLADGADLVGIDSTGGDVRRELLALFGRLPNLGGKLLSESFRGGAKMKTAQSAPELKWLMDGGSGPGGGGRGPGPPPNVVAPGRAVVKRPNAGNDGGQDAGSGDDDDEDEQLAAQRPAGRVNSKTATLAKKPLATVNGNGTSPNGLGRGAKKPVVASNGGGYGGKAAGSFGKPAGGGGNTPTNRLLLPPVVQPTVINALAAGAGAADAVASVSAATAAGVQKPWVRAARLPPGTPGQQQQKPTAPRRLTTPPSKPAAAPRQPVAKQAAARPLQPVKSQLSADRGPPAPGMARCPLCSRDFAADRLPKHQEVCQRTRERDRKRKVFDTSRKRLEAVAAEAGVDVSSFKKKSQKEDQRAAEKLKKKKDAWRRKHDQLVRNVRAARAVQRHLAAGGTVRDLPPELENASAPDPDDEADSDLVKCPHCGRSFNEASAERHIPLCADRQRNAAARMQNKKR